jgi:hypothetical protein
MIKNLLTTALFSFALTICKSQEIIWPSYSEVEIPDSLLNEKALFLSNVTTIGFNNVGQTDVNVFKRILILNDDGAEEVSSFKFYIKDNTNIVRLGARIIKEGGKIIQLGDGQISKTFKTVKDEYSGKSVRLFQINYPSLQIGDVIDLMYDIKVDNYILSDNLYLEDNYASLNSRITLRNVSNLEINAYVMNSSTQPTSKRVDGIDLLNWERKGVAKMNDSYFHAPSPKQQCLIYSLWGVDETLNYDAIFYLDYDTYPNSEFALHNFNNYFIDQSVYTSEDPILIKIQKLITYLDKSCTYKKNLQTEPILKVLGNIKDYEINTQNFFIVAQEILKTSHTKFWIGYTQSLLNGPFYNGIVSLSQLETRFLIIELEDGTQHFLFGPSEDRWYYLDEIPYYIEGNEAVAMLGKEGVLEKLLPVTLPKSVATDNTNFVKLLVKKEGEKLSYRRDDHLSGHFSTLVRSNDQSYWLHKFALEQDSLNYFSQESFYPYNLDVSTSDVSNFTVAKNETGTKSISLKNMIPQNIFSDSEEEENELYNYVILPFEKSIKYSVYYQSDVNVTLNEKNDVFLSNSVGEISYKSTQVNETIISISLTLIIKDRYLDGPEKLKAFEELLMKWSEVRQTKTTFNE